jgi:hypothetical protein
MLRRTFKLLLLLLSGWLLAGPLVLLQLGAWGWMLANYSQQSSFEQAIIDTFGDERPCDICRMIDVVSASESPLAPLQQDKKDLKLMLGLGRAIEISVPTRAYLPVALIICEPENAYRMVPTPPPKAA